MQTSIQIAGESAVACTGLFAAWLMLGAGRDPRWPLALWCALCIPFLQLRNALLRFRQRRLERRILLLERRLLFNDGVNNRTGFFSMSTHKRVKANAEHQR
jgi:hypothetical protein